MNVSKNDTLNVRKQSNYKSEKVGELPPDAYIGIEKCQKIKNSTWCRVYQLVQNYYSENFDPGWVNARYLQFDNRGYVIVKSKKNCDYALWCDDGKCEVIYDFKIGDNHTIVTLKSHWIERKYLSGESNFGVTPDNLDGVCNSKIFIEDYLKKGQFIVSNDVYNTMDTKRFFLSYPAFMKAKKAKNEGVTISHSVKLKHYSGSDMRDDRDILFERTLFNYNFRVFDTLKKALQSIFPHYKNSELINMMHYNSSTDWFENIKPNGFVTSDNFYGKEAYRIMIGAEGSEILYHIYRQNGKIVLATTYFDSNTPIDTKNNKIIPGKWSLPDEDEIVKHMVSQLKVR